MLKMIFGLSLTEISQLLGAICISDKKTLRVICPNAS